MTKLLIIGSSHVAAYKHAQSAFAELYPQITLAFFSIRSPLFLTTTVDENAVFAPQLVREKDQNFVPFTNDGQASVDTKDTDHILLVGHRFAFVQLAELLCDHDVQGWPHRGLPRLLSQGFLDAAADRLAQDAVEDAAQAFANLQGPATFAPAPYPASSIVERGDAYPLARTLRQYWAHPAATPLFDRWQSATHRALQSHGHDLLRQPPHLCDGPFATKPFYATASARLSEQNNGVIDHRHMNADFGLAMLCAYAENHLGLKPHVTEKPEYRERSA